MIKIFNIDTTNLNLHFSNSKSYNWIELKNEPILEFQNFKRTFVTFDSKEILDLNKRSSFTHKDKFVLNISEEEKKFFDENNIFYEKDNIFTLFKYETGDFFLNHCDSKLNVFHQYNCLIFCPYKDSDILEGGELIFTAQNNSIYKFNPSIETKQNRFVMLIFSIDIYHEVLPIIKGIRWVFKRPLFVNTCHQKQLEDTTKTTLRQRSRLRD